METSFWILGWILSILTIAGNSWKWFHRASCGRSASASHQNQSADRFAFSSRFLCWGVRCSLIHCSSVTWEAAAISLDPMRPGWILHGGSNCVRLDNEPVQLGTGSVYGCRKATETRQLHDYTAYHSTNIFSLGHSSWSSNFFRFHIFIWFYAWHFLHLE